MEFGPQEGQKRGAVFVVQLGDVHRDRRAAKKIEIVKPVFTTHTRFRTTLILDKRR